MTHLFQRAEGIILRIIPFGDYDQILILFTLEVGLVKLIYKGSRSKRRGVQGICIPLTEVEVVYREKNSEIFACQEIALLNSYNFLKKELSHLEAACDLLKVIAGSQLPGKPAPHLYELLRYYLNKIPQTPDLFILTASFRLKLLRHEGLMVFPFCCSECGKRLDSTAYSRSQEWRCSDHQLAGSLYWRSEEREWLSRLGLCQSFSEMISYSTSPEIKEKVKRLFEKI